jgi:hypothetical protein
VAAAVRPEANRPTFAGGRRFLATAAWHIHNRDNSVPLRGWPQRGAFGLVRRLLRASGDRGHVWLDTAPERGSALLTVRVTAYAGGTTFA